MDRVLIFCDGSLYQKTGAAGIGAVIVNRTKGSYREISRRVEGKSNTTIELMAAIAALTSLKAPALVDLYTDCRYVTDAIVPHKNLDRKLWEKMGVLSEKHHIAFYHIPRDRGDIMQFRSHELAQKAALGENQVNIQKRTPKRIDK